jgi:hypothetical protein
VLRCIEHFDGVVAESGYEQPLSFAIEGEMVDPAFNTAQFDASDLV